MTIIAINLMSFLCSRMTGCPKNRLLFKSFTGLTVKEFDDIYDKEIAKRYGKHEIKRLSKRKDRENDP